MTLPITGALRRNLNLDKVDNTSDVDKAKPGNPIGSRIIGLKNASQGIKNIESFGSPTGDNWSVAFNEAERVKEKNVVIPPGFFNTGRAVFNLNVGYVGPGSATLLSSGGDYLPADFSWIVERPFGGTGTGLNKFFSADGRYQNRDYRIIHPTLRIGLDEPYFAPELNKELSIFDNRGGSSGFVSRLNASIAAGATQIPLKSATGLSVGQQIAFNSVGNPLDTAIDRTTIQSISGNTLTVSPGVANPHTTNDYVTNGLRTMQARSHTELYHRGRGDAYINLYRVVIEGEPLPGTEHVFQNKTAGFDGGDINFSANGGYTTFRETACHDNGYDVAVAGEVITFTRNNNTGNLGAFWIGKLVKSDGSKPADAAYTAIGKFNCALDTVIGDFSSFGNTVINMKQGQGFTFDSQPDTTELYALWGKVRGRTWFGMEDGEVRVKVDNGGNQVIGIAVTAEGQLRQIRKPVAVLEATSNVTLTSQYQVLKFSRIYDVFNDYNITTGKFNCRVAGRYRVSSHITMAGSTAENTGVIVNVFKNDAVLSTNGNYIAVALGPLRTAHVDTIINCAQGDVIDIRVADGNAAGGILQGTQVTNLNIEYIG